MKKIDLNKSVESAVEDLKRTLEYNAKEELVVTYEGNGVFYAFGSELATLRLLKLYRFNKNAEQFYSENLNTFVFKLEMKFTFQGK